MIQKNRLRRCTFINIAVLWSYFPFTLIVHPFTPLLIVLFILTNSPPAVMSRIHIWNNAGDILSFISLLPSLMFYLYFSSGIFLPLYIICFLCHIHTDICIFICILHYFSFCIWLVLLNTIFSSSIHFLEMIQLCPLLLSDAQFEQISHFCEWCWQMTSEGRDDKKNSQNIEMIVAKFWLYHRYLFKRVKCRASKSYMYNQLKI